MVCWKGFLQYETWEVPCFLWIKQDDGEHKKQGRAFRSIDRTGAGRVHSGCFRRHIPVTSVFITVIRPSLFCCFILMRIRQEPWKPLWQLLYLESSELSRFLCGQCGKPHPIYTCVWEFFSHRVLGVYRRIWVTWTGGVCLLCS